MTLVLRLLFFSALFMFAQGCFAQTSHTAEHAQRCAGIFDWFAQSSAGDLQQQQRYQKIALIFDDIYQKEVRAAGAEHASIHEQMGQVIHQEIAQHATALREEGTLCGAWADNLLSQGDPYKFVPVFPKVIPLSVRQSYQAITQKAFAATEP